MKEKYEIYDELAKKYLSEDDYLDFQAVDKNDEEAIRGFFDSCGMEIYDSLSEGFKDYFEMLEITGIDPEYSLSGNGESFLIEIIKTFYLKDFELIKTGNIFVFMG